MKIQQFLLDVIAMCEQNKQLRRGQAMFNHLTDVDEQFAEDIRGSDIDPFFCDDMDDPRINGFIKALKEHNEST